MYGIKLKNSLNEMAKPKNKPTGYILNLDELIKFVFENENTRNTDSEICENYTNDDSEGLKLSNKSVKEVKTKVDYSAEATIRYDLVKTFITVLMEMPAGLESADELTLGDTIILNTMINNNMLTEI